MLMWGAESSEDLNGGLVCVYQQREQKLMKNVLVTTQKEPKVVMKMNMERNQHNNIK